MDAQAKLTGYVDLKAVYPIIVRADRHYRDTPNRPFAVDCTAVEDFSGMALAELSRSHRRAEARGQRFRLAGCTAEVRGRMVAPDFEALAS
jgi:anti-anti-sigma regulatory factor